MKNFLDKILKILKLGGGTALRERPHLNGKFHISYFLDMIDKIILTLIEKLKINTFRKYYDDIRDKKEIIFNNLMQNYIFKSFKHNNFLRLFVFCILLLLCFVLFKTTIDIFNYKFFIVIMFLNIFVLKILITNFEQNQKIQNLNLIFLYLNLFLFVLFFFDDLNWFFLELTNILIQYWDYFWKNNTK